MAAVQFVEAAVRLLLQKSKTRRCIRSHSFNVPKQPNARLFDDGDEAAESVSTPARGPHEHVVVRAQIDFASENASCRPTRRNPVVPAHVGIDDGGFDQGS
jgi:hypothetical protein